MLSLVLFSAGCSFKAAGPSGQTIHLDLSSLHSQVQARRSAKSATAPSYSCLGVSVSGDGIGDDPRLKCDDVGILVAPIDPSASSVDLTIPSGAARSIVIFGVTDAASCSAMSAGTASVSEIPILLGSTTVDVFADVTVQIVIDPSATDATPAFSSCVPAPSVSVLPSSLPSAIPSAIPLGVDWNYEGEPGFGKTLATGAAAVAIDSSGTPWAAFPDTSQGGKLTVMELSASGWNAVGGAGLSAGSVSYVAMALDSSGHPYVAFQDQSISKATVMHWNGSAWSIVGGAGISGGPANFIALALDPSGDPFVAYQDMNSGYKATVMHWNGSTWTPIGAAGFTSARIDSLSLALDPAGNPYVAFEDSSVSDYVTVMTWNGASWNLVGTAGFSPSQASSVALAINPSGMPYLAISNASNGGQGAIMSFNGMTWTNATPAFTGNGASLFSLAFDASGLLYVAYLDGSNLSKGTVQTWNGSFWSSLGPPGFNENSLFSFGFALSPSGIPHAWGVDNLTQSLSEMTFGPDANARLLNWSQVTPQAPGTVTAQWQPSVSQALSGQAIQFYSDEVCATPAGSLVSIGLATPFDATSGTAGEFMSFRVVSEFTGLPSNWSFCSPEMGIRSIWTYVNSHRVSQGGLPNTPGNFAAIALDSSGLPYVAYADMARAGYALVQHWSGSSWVPVGGLVSQSPASSLSISSGPGGVFVAFLDSNSTVWVTQWNGTSWVALGGGAVASEIVSNMAFAVSTTGTPYVAYFDGSLPGLVVMTWNGTSWNQVGTAFSASSSEPIALALTITGNPVLAYPDTTASSRLSVSSWNGSSWNYLGTAGLSAGTVGTISMAIDPSNLPTVAYEDASVSFAATVQHFNGSTWSLLGAAGITTDEAVYFSLALNSSGNPTLAYIDQNMSNKLSVLTWNAGGSNWINVGAEGFTLGSTASVGLAIDSSGTSWVGYADQVFGNDLVVRRFDP
jgi:hypothetical protein